MRTLTKGGKGLLCLVALNLVFAGCSKIRGEKYPLDVTDLDPFTQAMHYAKQGDVSELKDIIAADKDIVYESDENGLTLLHFAATSSQPDSIKLLLEMGADVNALDIDNITPLQAAEDEHADEKVLQLLRDAGGK